MGRLTGEHPLAALLDAAAHGSFPPADGAAELLGPPPGRAMAVVGFTAHFVVAAAVEEEWARERLPPRAERDDVRAFESAGGRALVVIGRGLAGRLEVAFEVDPAHRGRGLATAALVEARRLAEALFFA